MRADDLQAVAWIGGAGTDEGEPVDGPRGMALAAPRASMLLHRAADTALAGHPAPLALTGPEFSAAAEVYVEHARQFQPRDAYYLSNHRGHLMFVRPDERPFITAEMISRTSFIGTEHDLKTAHRRACRMPASPRRSSPSHPGRSTLSRTGLASAAPSANFEQVRMSLDASTARPPSSPPPRQGIGRATALEFAAAGARVIATDILKERRCTRSPPTRSTRRRWTCCMQPTSPRQRRMRARRTSCSTAPVWYTRARSWTRPTTNGNSHSN